MLPICVGLLNGLAICNIQVRRFVATVQSYHENTTAAVEDILLCSLIVLVITANPVPAFSHLRNLPLEGFQGFRRGDSDFHSAADRVVHDVDSIGNTADSRNSRSLRNRQSRGRSKLLRGRCIVSHTRNLSAVNFKIANRVCNVCGPVQLDGTCQSDKFLAGAAKLFFSPSASVTEMAQSILEPGVRAI